MQKKLSLFDLISIGVGCIIGSGIFALLGVGIAFSGRGIVVALFLAMFLCVLQSISLPMLTNIFELDGGDYAINSLLVPKAISGANVGRDVLFRAGSLAVGVLAIAQYLVLLVPALADHSKVVALVVLALGCLCVFAGDKAASRIQNVMCIFMYAALVLFVVYGLINMNPSAYAEEPMLPKGVNGLIMAIALMSYTCNGFQYVVNMGKAADKPTRNIPLAFCLSALVGAAIYALIGFAATHAFSYGDIAGKNLGDIAEMMMPSGLSKFFVIGGALFALGTSLVGAIISAYRPLMACSRDGWLPSALNKTTKNGTPTYVLVLLFLLGAIPILLGLDMGDVATICLFPAAIVKIIVNLYAMRVPERFRKEWDSRTMRVSTGLYRALLLISCCASVVLGVFYFISNNLKGIMIGVTIAVFAYGLLCTKFGHIDIAAQKEYVESKAE